MLEKIQKTMTKLRLTLPHLLPLILVIMLTLLISCSGQAPTTSPEPTIPSYTDVPPEEAYDMIAHQEVVVLDVRTQEEYDAGHIPDALLIPLSELKSRLNELNPSDHILVYCRIDQCSEEAACILVANGFAHVYNLVGGVAGWWNQGFPLLTRWDCPICGR